MPHKLAPFHQENLGDFSLKKRSSSNIGLRRYLVAIFSAVVFLVLFTRLFQLTIVKGSYYRYLAENNRIREVAIEAPRGDIVDRKGVTIVSSEKIGDKYQRVYKDGTALAHFVGYMQIASKEDIHDDLCDQKPRPGDLVGKSGIEKIYDCSLRGIKGRKLIEVDSRGRPIKVISYLPPQKGQTVKVSLDSYLQKSAYEALLSRIENSGGVVELKEKRAAVVATDAKTGEILIFISTPSFDPSVFVGNDKEAIHTLLTDEQKPLFNRATLGIYPPGSIIKPFIAIGALEDDVITPDFTVEDTGTIKAGPLTFGNWYFLEYGKTEGTVDLIKGLRRSNDIYFYKVGEKMGDTKIKRWAEKFGLGKNIAMAFPQSNGLIPSAFWKKDTLDERWFLGDTYNLSIGQGFLQVTPLQMNLATGAIANGGKLCRPQFLKDGPVNCRSLNITDKSLQVVTEGMRQACASGGTGWPFFDFKVKSATDSSQLQPISVGCKTGTAESHLPSGIPHAWFTVFAPYDNPEVAVTVLVEESGQGSNVAAPVAKQILKAYFERSE